MKKIFTLLFLAVLIQFVNAQDAATIKGEVLVRLKAGYLPEIFVGQVNAEIGIAPAFKLESCVSDYLRIWLFSFDEDVFSKSELLRQLNTINGVEVAQANHKLEERVTTPNDPFFSQQWHHNQAEDHDIDSDLAWDITTGGLTANGDSIVVCVVELGGAKWNVPDIIDNHWVNIHETPGNGIDDDANGYIDDYHGWNINTVSDVVGQGDHGTRVSSMIGAKGNNELGVTGVNWDVKIMQVDIGGVSEANAIAGYAYPLKMRKLYNETDGAQGAFVVATNSSWGTDGGQPSSAPLWCAMYDSLGVHGVLSCGSTSNSNVNVDVVGDLPTACPSAYMVSVGRTNSSDVRGSGGYGLTTIDLMAPGDNVYLANNNSYGTTTGTSFSGPCVAGAIALLYSAPCNSLIQIALANPATAAVMVRDYIFDGVDQTTQLLAETVSGGRLNVNNSLNLMLDECSSGACIAPFGITATPQSTPIDIIIDWNMLNGMNAFAVQYHVVGNEDWTNISDISTNSILLSTLDTCATYEIQIMAMCAEDESQWSTPFIFSTGGCCEAPISANFTATTITSGTLAWNDVFAANGYELTITPQGGTAVSYTDINDNPLILEDLLPCKLYALNIRSQCGASPFPQLTSTFHTAGCISCAEISYCAVSASASGEYIAQVTLGDINRISTSDNGYIFVTDATTTLHAQGNYDITVAPGYPGASIYNENFRAWIDFNSDGDFDDENEMIFDAPTSTTAAITGNFTVPANIINGSVTLRVGMRYTTGSTPVEPLNCGIWSYGETEDYCVMLDQTVDVQNKISHSTLTLFPNPADDVIYIQSPDGKLNAGYDIRIFAMDGTIVLHENKYSRNQLDISKLPQGIFTVVVTQSEKTFVNKLIRK